MASDEWLLARCEAKNLWKERGGLLCERNIGNGSTGVSKGKVFYREWLNLRVEWRFLSVEMRNWKCEMRKTHPCKCKPRKDGAPANCGSSE